jgi:delta14-sterol reductase
VSPHHLLHLTSPRLLTNSLSLGATAIVFGLPILMQVLYLGCNDVSGCPAPALLDPKTLSWAKFKSQVPWPQEGLAGFMSWEVTGWLFAYYFLSLVLYRILPAQIVLGTKLRESGKPLEYRFNCKANALPRLGV